MVNNDLGRLFQVSKPTFQCTSLTVDGAVGNTRGRVLTRVDHKPMFTLRPGAVYKIICSDCQATSIGVTGRNLITRLNEHKQATNKGDLNNNIAEHHLKKATLSTGLRTCLHSQPHHGFTDGCSIY